MTSEHMQTRSTQSNLKRVFGFNCFKFSSAYSETGKLFNKPRMLRIVTTLDVLKSSLYELGLQTDICGGYDSHNIARFVNSYNITMYITYRSGIVYAHARNADF
jgi:hypothetical protein